MRLTYNLAGKLHTDEEQIKLSVAMSEYFGQPEIHSGDHARGIRFSMQWNQISYDVMWAGQMDAFMFGFLAGLSK
jgi:hypothetical protein